MGYILQLSLYPPLQKSSEREDLDTSRSSAMEGKSCSWVIVSCILLLSLMPQTSIAEVIPLTADTFSDKVTQHLGKPNTSFTFKFQIFSAMIWDFGSKWTI